MLHIERRFVSSYMVVSLTAIGRLGMRVLPKMLYFLQTGKQTYEATVIRCQPGS